MSSKAVTEHRDESGAAQGAPLGQELAPSILREDELNYTRTIGMCGLVLALVGADLLCWSFLKISLLRYLFWGLARIIGRQVPPDGPPIGILGTFSGTVFFVVGLASMLFHATTEKEMQLRRTYGVFGTLWLATALVFFVLNLIPILKWATNLFLPAVGCSILAVLFLLAFVRNETEEEWRSLAIYLLGGVGGALAAVGLIFTALHADFLLPHGFVLTLLGLGYVWAFIGCRGNSDDQAYTIGLVTGVVGLAVILLALLRTYLLPLFLSFSAASRAGDYFIPTGVLLCLLGALAVLLYVLNWVETPILVMSRRELASFFYSPVAYLVLLGFTFLGWVMVWFFVADAIPPVEGGEAAMFEPIISRFFFGFFPVVAVICVVPLLTMRSLSEERRTGTLELLLTLPVDEWPIVLSKFFGTLTFFLLMWVPWVLFLVSVRIQGGQPFDYRPLLSFLIVLLFMGAHFVSMGLFFSSITRNQIISAVLTFAGMFGLVAVYLGASYLERSTMGAGTNPWVPVLNHMSFVTLWQESVTGKLDPQLLLFQLSATAVWLFLTVKVLEARKWS